MSLTRVRGVQFHVSRRKWNRATTCSAVTAFITFLYVLLFAKYAHFQMEFAGADTVQSAGEEEPSSGTCAKYPNTLKGLLHIDVIEKPATLEETAAANLEVKPGGTWSPSDCTSRQTLAIIVPYRDRQPHLQYLLSHLHPFLQRQKRHYRIYVVEQAYDDTFNKGRVMNIAYSEAMKDEKWDCIIFHDVDMVPQDDFNLYECGLQPRHLSPALDEMRYTLMYSTLVGGALALSREQMEKVNGYSNLYWGWGSEDDDMSMRIRAAGYQIVRPPNHIGRYKMIRHTKREIGRFRIALFADWERWPMEGLNSLSSLHYSLVSRHNGALYTNLTVDIGPKPEVPEGQKPKTLSQEISALIFFLLNV